MQDINQLRGMGLMDADMVDDMQEAIDGAERGKELEAAFNRINDLQNKPDNYKPKKQKVTHVRKHEKQPMAKNQKKRMRKHAF